MNHIRVSIFRFIVSSTIDAFLLAPKQLEISKLKCGFHSGCSASIKFGLMLRVGFVWVTTACSQNLESIAIGSINIRRLLCRFSYTALWHLPTKRGSNLNEAKIIMNSFPNHFMNVKATVSLSADDLHCSPNYYHHASLIIDIILLFGLCEFDAGLHPLRNSGKISHNQNYAITQNCHENLWRSVYR